MVRELRLLRRLLRLVTQPHWKEHKLRTALTVVGVSLGAATIVSVTDISGSVLESFRQMIRTLAGSTELEVTAPAGGVDETLVARVGETRDVVAAAGFVEAFVSLADKPEESLYLLGLDFLGSPLWRTQIPRGAIDIPDEFAFVSGLDSVAVTRRFAARERIALGSQLRVIAPGGPRSLTVRGILDDVPAARLFDGMVAVMDLPGAQDVLERDGRVDRIAVQVASGAEVEEVGTRLAAALGPGLKVSPPEVRGEQAEKLLLSLRSMLLAGSSFAVIVAVFIVYQTVSVSVYQRRRRFALLNTVGIGRGTLVRLCLAETLMLAVAGILLGLVGGQVLASLASRVVGDTASEIWLQVEVSRPTHSVAGMLAAAGVGLATALIAAYLAVRATFRAPTVEALRPAGVESETAGRAPGPLVAGVLLVATTWLFAFAPMRLGFPALVAVMVATEALAYAGAALLAPSVVVALGHFGRRFARSSSSLAVRLAVDNVPRSPGRNGTTVATITAALGMAVSIACVVQSFEAAWLGWIEQHFGGDLFVGSGAHFRLLAGPPMNERIGKELAQLSGVASVEPFRVIQIQLGDRPVFLQGIDVAERLAHGGLAMMEGDLARAAPSLREGTGVLVSDNLASRLGIGRGDKLELPTPLGPRVFRVEATFLDYLGSLDLGAVVVSRDQLTAIWGDRLANLFRVWLHSGASATSVRTAILQHLGGNGYYVITSGEFLDGVRSVLNRFFMATWALVLVAAVIGVIGVVNAQLATILDRGAEIAMMRVIGVTSRQITRSVLVECGVLGMLGGLGGLAIGTMLGLHSIAVSLPLVTGWRIPFHASAAPLVGSVVVAALVSALSGYIPARAAARLEVRQRSLD